MLTSILPPLREAFCSCLHGIASLAAATPWASIALLILGVVIALRRGLRNKAPNGDPPAAGPGKWAWIAVAVL